MEKSEHVSNCRDIFYKASELHSLIIKAMDALEGEDKSGNDTAEWMALHSALKSVGSVSDTVYAVISPRRSAFPEPPKYEPPF